MMTKAHYGMLAGIAGAAFAWWWRHRDFVARGMSEAGRESDYGFSTTTSIGPS